MGNNHARSFRASANPGDKQESSGLSPKTEGLVLANVVPFVWGTYAPCVKVLTNINPDVPLLAFNFITAIAGVATMGLIRNIAVDSKAKKTPLEIMLELGAYQSLGAILHLRSFSFTTPSRSAFLIQLTTLFVPLLEFVSGTRPTTPVIAAAALTVFGAAFLAGPADIVASGTAASSSFFSSVRPGDAMAVGAAFLYSLGIIRTEKLTSKAGSPLSLADGILRVQIVISSSFIFSSLFSAESSWVGKLKLLSTHDVIVTALCILWIGGATTAFTMWAQIIAQQRIGASRASVFYASQPVWTAGLSVACGFDVLTQSEIIGGALIAAAGLLVAVGGEPKK